MASAAAVFLLELPVFDDATRDRWTGYSQIALTVIIGLLAALIASWFQQRTAFLLDSLRRLWSHIVEARLDISDYLARPAHDDEAFWRARRALPRAIDEFQPPEPTDPIVRRDAADPRRRAA